MQEWNDLLQDPYEKVIQIQDKVGEEVKEELKIDIHKHWEDYEIQLSEDGQTLEYIYPNIILNLQEMHQMVEKFGTVDEKKKLNDVMKKVATYYEMIPTDSISFTYSELVKEIESNETENVEDLRRTFITRVSTDRLEQTEMAYTKSFLQEGEDFPFKHAVGQTIGLINERIASVHEDIIRHEKTKSFYVAMEKAQTECENDLKLCFYEELSNTLAKNTNEILAFYESYLETGENIEKNGVDVAERLWDQYLKTDYDDGEMVDFLEVNKSEFLSKRKETIPIMEIDYATYPISDEELDNIYATIQTIREEAEKKIQEEIGLDMNDKWENYVIHLAENDVLKLKGVYPNVTFDLQETHIIVQKFGGEKEKETLDKLTKKIALEHQLIPNDSSSSTYEDVVREVNNNDENLVEDLYQSPIVSVSTDRLKQISFDDALDFHHDGKEFNSFEHVVEKAIHHINNSLKESHHKLFLNQEKAKGNRDELLRQQHLRRLHQQGYDF